MEHRHRMTLERLRQHLAHADSELEAAPSRNVDEHLRQMNEQASLLDKSLRRHREESES